jgi:uncharacterized SAM-binding protein YcdF (DUF218 family)
MRALIDPLWLLIVVLVVAIFTKFNNPKINRVVKLLARVSIASLVFLSTNFATSIFDSLLNTEQTVKSNWSPEFIFVLGGGYEVGATPPEDFLGTESIRRVNAASVLWRKYPLSMVVFSGQEPGTEGERPPTRHGELAAERAVSLGLNKSRIIIESTSFNTQGHAIQAKTLSGIKSNTPIAMVTSNFHLRRALREFHRYFSNVYSFGTEDQDFSFSLISFVPFTASLDDNTYRIKEFVGIIVYQLTS